MGFLNDILIIVWQSVGPAVLISQGLKLFWAILGIMAIWLTSRVLDWLRGKPFRLIARTGDTKEMFGYLGLRWLGICLFFASVMSSCLVLAILLQPAPAEARSFTDRYDRQIQASAKLYMPGVPWRLWKAQLYQESRLDPTARSPVGAAGLAQFMPATWEEVTRAMGLGLVDRSSADASIQAGAFYMARLRRGWSSPRPETDRHDLAMASYNAGFGSILAAQKACASDGRLPVLYDPIMRCLPAVTGAHAAETLAYAPGIRRWFLLMQVGG